MVEPVDKVLENIALKIPVVRTAIDREDSSPRRRSRPLLGILIIALLVAISLPLVNITIIFPAYTKLLVATIEAGAERLAVHAVPASAKHARLSRQSIDSVRLLADIYRIEKDFEPAGDRPLLPRGGHGVLVETRPKSAPSTRTPNF